jgi:hypothetical protein
MKVQFIPPANFQKEMVKALVKVTGNYTDDMIQVLNDGLLEIESQAKVNAPVKTGRYRASIHTVAIGMKDVFGQYTDPLGRSFDGTLKTVPSPEPNTGYVGSNVEYAGSIEYGKDGSSEPWWGSYPITRAVKMKEMRITTALKNLKLRGMPTNPLTPNV